MAEEGTTTTTVDAPVENMETSFGAWNPGAQPRQDTPVVEAAVETPVNTDNPPAAEPPKTETEHAWLKEFGEFKDPDEFKGHYTTLKTEREQLEARLKEAEAKTVGYSSDAIAKMDAYARKLVQDGVTDAGEIQRKVSAFMQESTADYLDLARTNPASIIERSIKEKYAALGANEADIARAVRRETQLPEKPRLEDYGNDATDPEYVSKLDAYNDAESDLRLKAMGIAQEMEAKREKIDFQPKGVPTKEERERMVQEAAQRYNSRIPVLEAEIPRIEVAGQKLDFPLEGDYLASINEAIQHPAEFIDQFYTETGEPDVVAIGRMKAQIAAIPLLIERAVKQVVHNQTEDQDRKLINPDTRKAPENGGGTPDTNYEDSFTQWGRERQSR